MRTMKYLLFGALGVTAILLLTSERARKLRVDLEDKAKDKTDEWKGLLSNLGSSAHKTLGELRELLSNEIEGLSDDARTRIQNILNKSAKSTNGLKKKVNSQLS